MPSINWVNKATFEEKPDIPANQKITAGDMNQVKSVVNAKADQSALDTLSNTVDTLNSDLNIERDRIDTIYNTALFNNGTLSLDASVITSGTFNVERISEASVLQHQSRLSINSSQISNMVPVPNTRNLVAGDGIGFGASQNAIATLNEDVVIGLKDTPVTPGTYSTPGNIAVDRYGRITSIDNSNSGGGVGTVQGISSSQIINGDGSKLEFEHTHNQNTRDYIAKVYNLSTNREVLVDVVPNIADSPENKVLVIFNEAPALDEQFKLIILFTGAASGLGAGASGEANTASNVGSAGVGIFDDKNLLDLQFRKLNPLSNRVSIALDAGNKKIDIDVNQANLSITESQISDLGNYAVATHGHKSGVFEKTASYTLIESDKTNLDQNVGLTFVMNVGSANTFTVPADNIVNFDIGSIINIFQLGTGQTEILAGIGVTLHGVTDGSNDYKIEAQYRMVSIQKISANTWLVVGALAS